MKSNYLKIIFTTFTVCIGCSGNDTPADNSRFTDIEYRCIGYYENWSDSLSESEKCYLRAQKYVHIVNDRYQELRLSKKEAQDLGITPEIYDEIVDRIREYNELAAKSDEILNLNNFKKYQDAINRGLIDPEKEALNPYFPKFQSIRKRRLNQTE